VAPSRRRVDAGNLLDVQKIRGDPIIASQFIAPEVLGEAAVTLFGRCTIGLNYSLQTSGVGLHLTRRLHASNTTYKLPWLISPASVSYLQPWGGLHISQATACPISDSCC